MSHPTTDPAPNTFPLTSDFQYNGWKIKYALLAPSSPVSTNSTATKSSQTQPQTLVFIHGTPWSSAVFGPLATSLLSTHPNLQVLLYDLPGYGESQQHLLPNANDSKVRGFHGNTSIRFQASAFTALLSHLSLSSAKPAVIAHDIAGSIALRAHLLHDEIEFSRLLLMDTNAVLPWGDGFYKLARQSPQVFAALPGHVHEAVVRSVVRSGSTKMMSASEGPGGDRGGERAWEDVLTHPWIGSDSAQSSFVRQIAQADDGDVAEMYHGQLYGNVRCPVRVLWGEKDSWIPREKMDELCGLLGEKLEKELVVVERAGHLVMLDGGDVVEREVREWLAAA